MDKEIRLGFFISLMLVALIAIASFIMKRKMGQRKHQQ
ncbi:hypothetical protein BSG1_11636 [Bacillus sp. SG-1]|nr:hypothetical protein BSG1_11636 [Bacillus sp. SG-1]